MYICAHCGAGHETDYREIPHKRDCIARTRKVKIMEVAVLSVDEAVLEMLIQMEGQMREAGTWKGNHGDYFAQGHN
jgi:hypothetical protein